MVTVAEAIALGTRHHQAGHVAEAERIYRQVLAVEPNHPDALHLLGVLALQGRQFDTAVQLIGAAIRVEPMQAAYHANLGEAHRHLGKVRDAIACYRQAVKVQPDLAPAHFSLGMLLHIDGQFSEATESLREALRLKPEDVQARTKLGLMLQDQNELDEAEACFRRVLSTEALWSEAHFNLGTVLQSQNKLDEAIACYRKAIELQNDHAAAHNNLATILKDRSLFFEAIEHLTAALKAKPQMAAAHVNLGTIYQMQKRPNDAIAAYRAALESEPRNLLARVGLGAVFQSQERLTEAIAECEEAVRIDPNFAEAYSNIGVARNEQGRRDEAIAASRRAIELKPDYGPAHNNLAVALQALGRLDEAMVHHRRASELSPLGMAQCSNLLYALNYNPRYDAETIFAEHRAWAQRHADPLSAAVAPHANDRDPLRRLRIGYVSGQFRAHAVNFFSEPILASHDHANFEVFCYSNYADDDETTAQLRGYADHWRNITALSDQQASELIRDDRIDVLVDLNGHIGGHRLLVFARKPAPVQVTYIGYQNTTGMKAMDYRLTDDYADPPGTTDAFYTERLVRLPRSFYCYLPSYDAPSVNKLPALENGYITFGSFNSFAKITPTVLDTWGRLLAAVAGSRLLILSDVVESLQRRLADTFAGHGVSADRVTLANRRPRATISS